MQEPPQLRNVKPEAGVAVRVMVPEVNGVAWLPQANPQLIPEGTETTVPAGALFFETVKVNPKVAVTLRACETVSPQVKARLLQAPVHPIKVTPVDGEAVSVTKVL